MKALCVCGCGQRGVQRHHVVTRQELRKWGGSEKDKRNLVPMSPRCHGRHHSRMAPLELRMLPDSVFEFARETMGGEAAHAYLGRYYGGKDPRMLELLEGVVS